MKCAIVNWQYDFNKKNWVPPKGCQNAVDLASKEEVETKTQNDNSDENRLKRGLLFTLVDDSFEDDSAYVFEDVNGRPSTVDIDFFQEKFGISVNGDTIGRCILQILGEKADVDRGGARTVYIPDKSLIPRLFCGQLVATMPKSKAIVDRQYYLYSLEVERLRKELDEKTLAKWLGGMKKKEWNTDRLQSRLSKSDRVNLKKPTTTLEDNFNRANGPLGDDWTISSFGTWAITVVSNQARTGNYYHGRAYATHNTPLSSGDCYSEVQVLDGPHSSNNDVWCGPYLRLDTASSTQPKNNSYWFITLRSEMRLLANGAQIGTHSASTYLGRMQLDAQGSSLVGYRDTTSVISVTNTTRPNTNLYVGFMSEHDESTDTDIYDNFIASDGLDFAVDFSANKLFAVTNEAINFTNLSG